ncbi:MULTISPECIES: hypothetical protein [unclassified Moraxella]|uniref:hypothetical protein n=1 Tax=unclassified Moraxella TaxID=2685852 RepID=UPI002B414B03|nr:MULTISPECIES: hypothetical protein [unclassified Moraxella]
MLVKKIAPVKALFDAYMGVVEKHYPNLTLNFVKEGGFNAYYQNSQITVNEQVWESLADNDKVRSLSW